MQVREKCEVMEIRQMETPEINQEEAPTLNSTKRRLAPDSQYNVDFRALPPSVLSYKRKRRNKVNECLQMHGLQLFTPLSSKPHTEQS